VPFADAKERLLFAEAVETVRCRAEGVLRSNADANIGSWYGIGFPAWTGGAAQFVAGHPGGVQAFVDRAHELAQRYARVSPHRRTRPNSSPGNEPRHPVLRDSAPQTESAAVALRGAR
jgi:hypothetical protein